MFSHRSSERACFDDQSITNILQIVDRDSADGPSEKNIPIKTDHSGLNKCARKEGQLYKELKHAVDRIRKVNRGGQLGTALASV